MTYRLVFYDDAQEQSRALPLAAWRALEEVIEVIELVPWNGRPYNRDKPASGMREFVFGADGRGTVTYLILDDQQRVDVLLIQWAG